MLTHEENELVSRVGPGTPMGNLMRQYWMPAMLSSELPSPDSDPVRVVLLGEKLIAFRDTNGQVGLLDQQLSASRRVAVLRPQRRERPALRLPRLEVRRRRHVRRHAQRAGRIGFQARRSRRRRTRPASAAASSGRTWVRAQTPPPLPDLEANMLPDGEWPCRRDPARVQLAAGARRRHRHQPPRLPAPRRASSPRRRDAGHLRVLHGQAIARRATRSWTPTYGAMYGAYRPADGRQYYWRIAQFLFPFYAMIPHGRAGPAGAGARLGADGRRAHDVLHHGLAAVAWRRRAHAGSSPLGESCCRTRPTGTAASALAPNSTQRLPDRSRQAARASDYTGIAGIHTQDQAITESMGPIYDRIQEHLGTSDVMVIRVRRRLIAAARALRESGESSPPCENPAVYRTRSGSTSYPRARTGSRPPRSYARRLSSTGSWTRTRRSGVSHDGVQVPFSVTCGHGRRCADHSLSARVRAEHPATSPTRPPAAGAATTGSANSVYPSTAHWPTH